MVVVFPFGTVVEDPDPGTVLGVVPPGTVVDGTLVAGTVVAGTVDVGAVVTGLVVTPVELAGTVEVVELVRLGSTVVAETLGVVSD